MHSGSKLEKYTHLYLQYTIRCSRMLLLYRGVARIDNIIFAYHAITITVHVAVRVDKYDIGNKGNKYAIVDRGFFMCRPSARY